jgi:hypothetical protein
MRVFPIFHLLQMTTIQISLFKHQELAIEKLKTGSILCGGVGSGKSLTAIMYYFKKECGGEIDELKGLLPMANPKDLYIITTAAKRDTFDWEHECSKFDLSKDKSSNLNNVHYVVDSWNNIKKYVDVKNSFFIFDEQRVVGSGSWVTSFLKIVKQNNWILLSATPGDTWMDYIPVFIANGFYKNRTEFIRRHVIFNRFIKFPKVDRYVDEDRLNKIKAFLLVNMPYQKPSINIVKNIEVTYDKDKLKTVLDRWNPYTNSPIKNVSEFCYTLRRVVNSDSSRLFAIRKLISEHGKLIVFYNFNYELEILRNLYYDPDLGVSEHNGHKHEDIPKTQNWVYIVQYLSGAEGWNCIETNAIAFYSLNYSYRIMTQAAGRIDRLNTPFTKLYYYNLKSNSVIDNAISLALQNKKNFNESDFSFGEN